MCVRIVPTSVLRCQALRVWRLRIPRLSMKAKSQHLSEANHPNGA